MTVHPVTPPPSTDPWETELAFHAFIQEMAAQFQQSLNNHPTGVSTHAGSTQEVLAFHISNLVAALDRLRQFSHNFDDKDHDYLTFQATNSYTVYAQAARAAACLARIAIFGSRGCRYETPNTRGAMVADAYSLALAHKPREIT